MPDKPIFSILIDRRRSESLQSQIYVDLRNRIRTGEIAAGKLLPSSRELASDLGVSRNTIIAAYDRLLGEGYLETVARSGIYVRKGAIDSTPSEPPSATTRDQSIANHPSAKFLFREPIPFRPSQPDVRLFPLPLWNRMRTQAFKNHGRALLHYQSGCALGLPILRQAIAQYLYESRGVTCDWSQIAITGGSQHALFLLSQLLVQKGDHVYVETPGYPGAVKAFQYAGAKIRCMTVDRDGVVAPKIDGTNRRSSAKVIYTTPSRQFPTGACLPIARRNELLAFMRHTGAWLIEDDYDSEFRYSRPPLPSLHSLDTSKRVIYVGSMSKVLFPSLRIGYLVLPEQWVAPFESLRLMVDDHGPLIDQATLAKFISAGEFYRHLRRCRKIYAQRLDAFLNAANKHRLPTEFPFPDGGMNQCGLFSEPRLNSVKITQSLSDAGLDIPSLDSFRPCDTRSTNSPAGLVFGFSAFDIKTIESSMAKVAKVLRSRG